MFHLWLGVSISSTSLTLSPGFVSNSEALGKPNSLPFHSSLGSSTEFGNSRPTSATGVNDFIVRINWGHMQPSRLSLLAGCIIIMKQIEGDCFLVVQHDWLSGLGWLASISLALPSSAQPPFDCSHSLALQMASSFSLRLLTVTMRLLNACGILEVVSPTVLQHCSNGGVIVGEVVNF